MKNRTVQLGEVAAVDRLAASEAECAALPYVGLEHIEKDSGNFTDGFRCKPETLLATKFKFTSRHVLYGKLRPYLNKVALPDFDGVCTTEILPLIPKDGVLDRGFLSRPFAFATVRKVGEPACFGCESPETRSRPAARVHL